MVVVQLTTLHLTPEEVKLFVMMRLLQSLGVFDIKGGSVEIHFTSTGEIGNVDIHKSYKVANK